jgi:2-amino-4-hydroxy-6-hydroxymethyldihydropteridine diphosphokinase
MSEAERGNHAGDRIPSSAVRVFLSLGSNLGDRSAMLAQARALLDGPDLRIVAASSVYETLPWGVTDQPRYLNQVLEGRTTLSPRRLLHRCQDVETRLGRVRSTRWGPRIIDVDILLYGGLEINEPDLTIPHPQLADRAFVLVPLAELDAALRIPGRDTIGSLLEAVPDRAGVRVYRGNPESPARADR